jgi:tetratricopeptide (TPR) repeat protein
MSEPAFRLFVVGRLRGVTRARLSHAVEAAGGRLARSLSSRVDLVALSHRSATTVLSDAPPLAVPAGIPGRARLVSELTLKRKLGLLPRNVNWRDLSRADVEHASGLDPAVIDALALFDVLDPVDDCYSFRDLRSAREAHRLLELGFGLSEIAESAALLGLAGRGLYDTALAEAPWGDVMQKVGERLGRLNGQLELALDHDCETADEVFTRAEECEATGDLHEAERLYHIARAMDRMDPVIPFNLGNVLDGRGYPGEAALYYQEALARDPNFVEAWVNLAAVYEKMCRPAEAEACLRRAVDNDPSFNPALYNLARLLTLQERLSEAASLWDLYLAHRPDPIHAKNAARMRAYCNVAKRWQPD